MWFPNIITIFIVNVQQECETFKTNVYRSVIRVQNHDFIQLFYFFSFKTSIAILAFYWLLSRDVRACSCSSHNRGSLINKVSSDFAIGFFFSFSPSSRRVERVSFRSSVPRYRATLDKENSSLGDNAERRFPTWHSTLPGRVAQRVDKRLSCFEKFRVALREIRDFRSIHGRVWSLYYQWF